MKKTVTLILTLVLCLALVPMNALAADAMLGDGSPENPYQITTYAQLVEFFGILNGGDTDACGKLMNDITSDGSAFRTYGYEKEAYNSVTPYTGTFDGCGKTVTGLKMVSTEYVYQLGTDYLTDWYDVAMFARIGESGTVKNIRFKDLTVGPGERQNSAAITFQNRGTVEGIIVESGSISGGDVGGIVLENLGTVQNCLTGDGVTVSAYFHGGGICYMNTINGVVSECVNRASLTACDGYALDLGGISGLCNGGTVKNCLNIGNVKNSTDNSGGITVILGGSVSIENCINVGRVESSEPVFDGDYYVSAVVANFYNNHNCTVTNCYYDSDTVNCTDSVAAGKTTAQLTKSGVLEDLGFSSSNWKEQSGSYPMPMGVYKLLNPADDPPASENNTVTVSYSVKPMFTVTIPETVTLGTEMTVSAEDVFLLKGQVLYVFVSETSDEDNEFILKSDGDVELAYTVKAGTTDVKVGVPFLSVDPAKADSGSVSLSFEIPEDTPVFAGEYTGTVTFTVTIE